MKKLSRTCLILVLFAIAFFTFLATRTTAANPLVISDDLISAMVAEDTTLHPTDADLQFIIAGYYNASEVQQSVANGVLSFLTGAYEEHGYDETGSWVSSETYLTGYKSFKGELPEYKTSDFLRPVAGHLTSCYGFRPSFGRVHKGVDMALSAGDTVRSALPGIVTRVAFQKGGYGNYVVVAHSGDVETLYAHLSACVVMPGQTLKKGDPVGLGGNTGNATGPHLHFETRYRGIALDPAAWFDFDRR